MYDRWDDSYEDSDEKRAWSLVRQSMILLLAGMAGIVWVMGKVTKLYMGADVGEWFTLGALKSAGGSGTVAIGVLVCLAASCVSAFRAIARTGGRPRSAGTLFFFMGALVLVIWAMLFLEYAGGPNVLGWR